MPDNTLGESELSSLSLKILAILYYGQDLSGVSCKTCTEKESRNCSMDNIDKDVFYNDDLDISINTCPLNCIINEHRDFADRYIYYTETGATMPRYEDCGYLFWSMWKEFTSYKIILESRRLRG